MRIAHLSDFHLRHHLPGTASLPERESRTVLKRLEQAIAAIAAEGPDLLVVSGDLLDYPLDALDDAETQQQGEADLRLLSNLLAEAGAPLALVHGNHDHPALVRKVFGHLSLSRPVAGHQVICFDDDEDAEHHPRRLGASLQRLHEALAVGENSPLQIHIQHFLVWPWIDGSYPYNYRQAAWMRDQIVESGRVRLVLSGHYHAGVPLFQLGETYFATAPAFSEPPYPYWLYEIDEDGVRGEERVLGDSRLGD